jgi:hypothetical protein
MTRDDTGPLALILTLLHPLHPGRGLVSLFNRVEAGR